MRAGSRCGGEAKGGLGHHVDDGASLGVVMAVAEAGEAGAAFGHQFGQSVRVQVAPHGERDGEVVHHRTAAEHRGTAKGEAEATRDLYGRTNFGQSTLLARRLVEAGVRCVTISYSFWDYHGANFANCRENLPQLDQGITALVGDLHRRGLDRRISAD